MIYGYARVSTSQQAEGGSSISAQCAEIERYAVSKGGAVDAIYTDAGVSASVPLSDRPAGGEMFDVLMSGDLVVVTKLDRLFRSARDALNRMHEFRERNIDLHIIQLGGSVQSNGLASLMVMILSGVAQIERELAIERTQASVAHRRAEMKYLGGKVPWGWRNVDGQLEPDPMMMLAKDTAKTLHDGGVSLRSIQSHLGLQGVRVSLGTLSGWFGD